MKKDLIVLLSRQRSGTNAIRAVLNSHPEIHCFEEVLNPDEHYLEHPWSYFHFVEKHCQISDLRPSRQLDVFERFVDHLHELHDKPRTLIDLKINTCAQISSQWRPLTRVPLFDWIESRDIPVVRLTRNNYLRIFLSTAFAAKRGVWHDREANHATKRTIELPCASGRLLEQFDHWHREDELVEQILSGIEKVLKLEYSELFPRLNEPIDADLLQQLAEFLQVDNQFEVETWCAKSTQQPLWSAIANWRQVAQTLSGTPWESFLEDEPMYRGETEVVVEHRLVKLVTAAKLIAKLREAA